MAEAKKKLSLEKLKALENELLEKRAKDEEKLKRILEDQAAIVRASETQMGMAFWRFMTKYRTKEYEKVIASPDFDAYVTSARLRSLFSLKALKKDAPKKGQAAKSEHEKEAPESGWTELALPYKEMDKAMAVAQKIAGEGTDPHTVLQFDRARHGMEGKGAWILRPGVDPGLFSQWLPKPN